MYYFKALSGILACIAAVKAQTAGFNPFLTPTAGQKIKAGQNFDIVWEPSGAPIDATVSIKLLQGDTPTTMQQGPNVASKISSKIGRFSWHVPESIRDYKSYGFVMFLDGKEEVFQYSFPFDIECLDNNENHPATPPVPKKMPNQGPDVVKVPSPKNPDIHHDHDGHDDHDDDNDDDEDDDDDDDDDVHLTPGPTGVPFPNPKFNNGTYPDGLPKPSAGHPPAAKPSASFPPKAKPSAAFPPATKPSAAFPPAAKPSSAPPAEKPKPEFTNGAKMIAINSLALICGLAISIAF